MESSCGLTDYSASYLVHRFGRCAGGQADCGTGAARAKRDEGLRGGHVKNRIPDTMSTPPKVLTTEQEKYLRAIEITLNNLDFAELMAQVVRVYLNDGLELPKAFIRFEGKHLFNMGSGTCAVVANPILHIAALDCRRAVEFFGLMFDRDQEPPVLVPLSGKKKKRKRDDIGIEHFDVLPVTRDEFLKVTKLDEATLDVVDRWASKQIAHSTNVEPTIAPGLIEQVAPRIIKAFHVLLYKALGLRPPEMQLKRVSA
jgi:hypothetical protein